MLLLVLVFLINNVRPWEEGDFSTETISLTLACSALLAALLAVEGGSIQDNSIRETGGNNSTSSLSQWSQQISSLGRAQNSGSG